MSLTQVARVRLTLVRPNCTNKLLYNNFLKLTKTGVERFQYARAFKWR